MYFLCPFVLTTFATERVVTNPIFTAVTPAEQASPVTKPPHSGSASTILSARSKASLKPLNKFDRSKESSSSEGRIGKRKLSHYFAPQRLPKVCIRRTYLSPSLGVHLLQRHRRQLFQVCDCQESLQQGRQDLLVNTPE